MKTAVEGTGAAEEPASAARFQFSLADRQSETCEILPTSLMILVEEALEELEKQVPAAARSFRLVDHRCCFYDLAWCDRLDAAVTAQDAGPARLWEVTFYRPSGATVAKATVVKVAEQPDRRPAAQYAGSAAAPGRATGDPVADRQEVIAGAAVEIIAEKGFAAASMREIAAAAGMHVPTMYQYVKSKEEVLELVYRWVIQRVRENLGPALSLDLPPARKIEAVIARLITGVEAMRRETGVLNRETRSLSRPARQRVLDDYAEIVGRIGELVARGSRSGAFRDVDPLLIANFIDALCDTWSLRRFAFGPCDIATFEREVAKFVLHGLARPQADPAGA